MVPKTSYSRKDSSYPRQIQCFGRPIIENGQQYQNRIDIGSINCEFNFPNVQLSQSGSVCNTFQSQTSTLCIPSSGQSNLCDRRILHELEPSLCLRISSNNIDSFCPEQDTSVSVQNSSYSPSLATMNMVLRGTTTTSFSSTSSSALSKTIDSSKKKVSTSESPSTQLYACEFSKNQLETENFRKKLQILSPNQNEHQLRRTML